MKKLFLLTVLCGLTLLGANAQRVTDKLDRGLVAVKASSGNFVSWRKFGTEYYDTKYNLYRNGSKIASDLEVSNFQDNSGTTSSTYQVEAVVRGVVQEKSAAVTTWASGYFDVKVQPVTNRAGQTIGNSVAGNTGGEDTSTPGYTLNDVSLADVTGDGITEFIVKRNNSQGNLRTASNKTDFNLYECYKLDGTRLWWIDLGPNLMAGADEQWDMIAYDWDQDGKAEALMRGADNMIIHTATGKTINIGDMTSGFNGKDRPEYMGVGNEYLLYLNGETGEPYGWDGSENWTPMAYPLPQFEANETKGDENIWGDLGHRMMKHYFGAPYLDGRNPSIFLGRGCYTRHKACALDVNPATHELTQRWRWNCYDSASPWYGNGFHNFSIADVDMDGRDEIIYGSMILDDTGFGLATTGLGHGDAQHCGDLDPYRWGLEHFTCQEGSQGNSYWNATTGQLYYRKADGGDDGRSLAGNFTDLYPGGQGRSVSSGVVGLSCDKIVNTNGDAMSGNYSNLNNRIYWDGDLLSEIFNAKNGANRPGTIFKWGGSVIKNFDGVVNNWTKCNPSAQGDIIGDWREEMVLRTQDNSALRIYTTGSPTSYGIYTLWHDHQYRNAMAWQCVGYNQPPHPSFFLGNLENITIAPPPLMLDGRTEVTGSIGTTDSHLLISGYEDKTIAVQDGASPYILTVNAPAWVQGTGSQQATSSTPKSPERNVITYTTTLTGGAFAGSMRLVKQGEGVLVLPNVVQKHTGETNVWQGTLQFDGTFESSPLWLNRHTTLISNGGIFKGGIKADYNATIYPGGKDNVGSLTTTTLNLSFGSRIVFDGANSAFDQLTVNTIVIDAKTAEPWISYGPTYKAPVLQFNYSGELAEGTYELATVDEISGSLEEVIIEGISKEMKTELVHEGGKLKLVVEKMRAAGVIVWNGTTETSLWKEGSTKNFLIGEKVTESVHNDEVIFNDDAAVTELSIRGAVSPKSVTFNNDTKNYVINGDSIIGGGELTKNGAGTVTINSQNHIGNTVINAGKLVVGLLANNSGQAFGALGDASKTITVNDGATLSSNGIIITDQPVTIAGTSTIEVQSGASFTFNKAITGSNASLVKIGAGTMTLGPGRRFAKLIVKQGTVNAPAVSHVDQLPTNVEFGSSGIIWGANEEDTPGITNSTNFVVPKSCKGTFYGSFRGTYSGKLTGEGTFNVYTGGVRCYWNGNWSEFTGKVVLGEYNRQNKKSYDPVFTFNNTYGLPKATLNVPANVDCSNEGKNFKVGTLTGAGNLSGTGKWTVGYRNEAMPITSMTISSPVEKVGSGKMTITPGNTIKGALTVSGGVVTFNDSKLESTLNGANALVVKDSGRVVGQALVYTTTINKGGELRPCGATYSETIAGTIKSNFTITANEGSLVTFIKQKSKNSMIIAKNFVMNGTLKVVFNNYTPTVGDEFTLWEVSGTFSGTPTFDLPELPAGMEWDTSKLTEATGILSIKQATGIHNITADSDPLNVYNLSGRLVKRLATASDIYSLPAGIYIQGGKKIVIK